MPIIQGKILEGSTINTALVLNEYTHHSVFHILIMNLLKGSLILMELNIFGVFIKEG